MGIAILDSDKSTASILAEIIGEMGETPSPFTDKDGFLGAIDPASHRAAVISEEFLDVIEGTKQVYPDIEILAIGSSCHERCLKAGAAHFLKKPFPAQDFRQTLCALLSNPGMPAPSGNGSFIAADPAMRKIIEVLHKVAPTQAPVLIQGESGTGKEVIARYIHRHSRRKNGPYVGINLAAIPDTLLESELFGYEKGAFTGAYATRIGKFELADRGTILLDEVTEISIGLQAKLLRVLQERQIDRVGAKASLPVDFRVIATTNRDIEQDVREGRFRSDLYFRLNVIPIRVPALRDRRMDILPLAEHFISKVSRREGMPEKSLSPQAQKVLLDYHWPGNVRELENVIERAMILSDDSTIPPEALLPGIPEGPAGDAAACAVGTTIHDMEKKLIFSTLEHVNGNRTKAAALLGISIRTLRNKLNEYSGKGQFSDG
ncbi:MAG: sigma-54 dependent transcriptional regulator [Desulfomonilia bacterium]|jgi:two-component system response regulator FlrC